MLFGKKSYYTFWKGGADYYFLKGLNFNCPIVCPEKIKFWGGQQRSSAPAWDITSSSVLCPHPKTKNPLFRIANLYLHINCFSQEMQNLLSTSWFSIWSKFKVLLKRKIIKRCINNLFGKSTRQQKHSKHHVFSNYY